ncbi:MAG: RraA family protein [Anaerolineae bacterium]|jgi:regulator of RNase E activity RraA|nr:RraA family protein [Anaerolineae bacterium]
MAISPATLAQLRKIDTPTVCNLIELFNVRPRNLGYMDARIEAAFPEMPPMVGFAATATFRSAAPPRKGDAYAGTADQVERFGELSGPAVVVFQDVDNPPAAATFGEVMCTTYKAFGAVGLITSGAGRDLEQVRTIDFPVFTNGTMCAHGYTHIPQIMTPVHVGGIIVSPDDLLHGDCNGVTTIPHDIAAELADIADDFIAAEAVVIGAMREPNPTPQRLREAVVEMRGRMDAMRAKVARKQG